MTRRMGLALLIVSIIWAIVILATQGVLDDTPQFSRELTILGGGAAATIILLGGLTIRERKS